MAEDREEYVAELRGPKLAGRGSVRRYAALTPGQPLILSRQRNNPVDSNAVIASDMMMQPVAFIDRYVAAIIAPKMDAGITYLCKVRTTSPVIKISARGRAIKEWFTCIIWRDDKPEEDENEESFDFRKFMKDPANKEPEHV